MKSVLGRDVPTGAAIAIAALVLLASAVTGREQQVAAEAPAGPRSPQPAAAAREDLDINKLQRQRSQPDVQDLFASPVAATLPAPVAPENLPAPVPAAAPAPPPAPAAPALPYRYLGRITRASAASVYLVKSDTMFVVAAGDTIEATYRVDSISDTAIHLTYLPLGSKEVLPIPPAP